MALENTKTKEYLKVTNFGNEGFEFLIFANKDQRNRWEIGGLSEYEVYKAGNYNSKKQYETHITDSVDTRKNVKDNMTTKCYRTLKSDMFAEWEDV